VEKGRYRSACGGWFVGDGEYWEIGDKRFMGAALWAALCFWSKLGQGKFGGDIYREGI